MACSIDQDCPFNEVCYQDTVEWVLARGLNSTCGCDYWHGAARNADGQCLDLGPGAYYMLADAAFQIVLAMLVLLYSSIAGRKLSAQGRFGNNPLTVTYACSFSSVFCYLVNRIVMFSKVLTPQLYVSCCTVVLGEPRKTHDFRLVESVFVFASIVLGVLALNTLALSWISTAVRTSKLSSGETGIVRCYKYFFYGSIGVFGVLTVVLLFVNTGFTGGLALVFSIVLAGSFIYGEKKIYPLLHSIGGVGSSMRTDISYGILLDQIRKTTWGIVAGSLLFAIAGSIYFATNLLYAGDWKGASPPDAISLNAAANNWLGGSMLLNMLVLTWFLYQRAKRGRSSSRTGSKGSFVSKRQNSTSVTIPEASL